jgi:hypothetical protein
MPAATASATATGYPVQVFFSKHPASDSNPATVFPVARVSPDINVATYAVHQLIAGPTAAETSQGYFTPLPSALTGLSNCGGADFQLALNTRGTTAESGTATLRFCRQVSSSGVVTDAHINSEVTKTLLQFSTIHKVVILNATGSCFGDESGQNLCLQ